jgi:hypothetical protein
MIRGVTYLEEDNFYYLSASKTWPDKRCGLSWEWPDKRCDLSWEWPDKRYGFSWTWSYKRGTTVRICLFLSEIHHRNKRPTKEPKRMGGFLYVSFSPLFKFRF